MTVYRPSCVVNIRLKFDKQLTLLPRDENPETVQSRLDSPPRKPGVPKPEPFMLEKGAENESWIMARVPKSLSYEKPGYRQAAKFSMTIDYRDLPLDPRTVSAAAVEIHTGAISDADFSQGYRGRDSRGRLLSVLQTRTESGFENVSTLRMYGTVDEWKVSHDEGGSVVHISGRDLRGILIDFPISPKGVSSKQFWDSIDFSQNIADVVVQMLMFNPMFDDLQVFVNPEEWPNATVPLVGANDFVPRHRKGARGKRSGGRASPPSTASSNSMSFWDAIVRVCFLVGAIPYFRNQTLLIRPASSIFDKLRGPVDANRNPTPFAGAQERTFDAVANSPITPGLRVRRLVYGRDVKSLTFQRTLGGKKRPTIIQTVAIDPESDAKGAGKQVIGLWPPQDTKRAQGTRDSPGRGGKASEVSTFPIYYTTDPVRLTEIAHSIYEEIARSEMGGTIETKNLASFGGDSSDPDLLTIEPGDAIEVLVDTHEGRVGSPFGSSYTDANRVSFEAQVREVNARVGDENLARAIVATARGQVSELQRFFRVETMSYKWSHTDGASVAFDFQNYLVVESQVGEASARPGSVDVSVTAAGDGNRRVPGKSLRAL